MKPMTGKKPAYCQCKMCIGRGGKGKQAFKKMYNRQERQKEKTVIEQQIEE